MTESPLSASRDPLVTYDRDPDERIVTAVTRALSQNPIEFTPDPADPLYEWIDVEAVETVLDSARGEVYVSTVIWDYDVVITSERITVFETPLFGSA